MARGAVWFVVYWLMLTCGNHLASGQIRIRVSVGNAPPFEYRDAERKPQGFAVDVLREAARRQGVELVWVNGGSAAQNNADLRAGRLDLIAAAPPTAERRRDFYVSDPWWQSEMLALTTAEGALRGEPDLNGHRLAVPVAAADAVSTTYPDSNVLSGPNTRWAADQLCLGTADAALVETVYLRELLLGASRACRDTRVLSFDVKSQRPLCLIARPGIAPVAAGLRDRIQEVTADGSLEKLASKQAAISTRQAKRMGELLLKEEERRAQRIKSYAGGMLALTAIGVLLWQYRSRSHFQKLNSELLTAQFQSNERLGTVMSQLAELKASESERARLNDALAQSRKLEPIGRLAGGVAHDFNNLLTVVNGYADILLSDSSCPDNVRTRVRSIRNAGEQAALLTTQLLAFAKKRTIEPKPTNLNSVIRELAFMLRPLLPANIQLECDLEPELANALVDPGHMHQMLMNLVLNARDAMPDGGILTIRSANIDPAGSQTGEFLSPRVMVAVSDTGAGMEPELAEKIFEPFFTTKPIGAGTGLGLSTVHGIVAQSGGTIEISTQPGVGSEFRVCFPAILQPLSDESAAPAQTQPPTSNVTIMVVEDRDDLRLLFTEILKGAGYRVLDAASGADCLKLTTTVSHIDILLTDIMMPGMTGPELVSRMNARQPDLKVLYMSGYPEYSARDLAGSLSRVAFMAKPVGPEVLLSTISALANAR